MSETSELKPAPEPKGAPDKITRVIAEGEGGSDLVRITEGAQRERERLKNRATAAAEERAKLRDRVDELDDVLVGLDARAAKLSTDCNSAVGELLEKLGVRCDLATAAIERPDPKRPNDLIVTYIPKE